MEHPATAPVKSRRFGSVKYGCAPGERITEWISRWDEGDRNLEEDKIELNTGPRKVVLPPRGEPLERPPRDGFGPGPGILEL